jgi:hypothetical protein
MSNPQPNEPPTYLKCPRNNQDECCYLLPDISNPSKHTATPCKQTNGDDKIVCVLPTFDSPGNCELSNQSCDDNSDCTLFGDRCLFKPIPDPYAGLGFCRSSRSVIRNPTTGNPMPQNVCMKMSGNCISNPTKSCADDSDCGENDSCNRDRGGVYLANNDPTKPCAEGDKFYENVYTGIQPQSARDIKIPAPPNWSETETPVNPRVQKAICNVNSDYNPCGILGQTVDSRFFNINAPLDVAEAQTNRRVFDTSNGGNGFDRTLFPTITNMQALKQEISTKVDSSIGMEEAMQSAAEDFSIKGSGVFLGYSIGGNASLNATQNKNSNKTYNDLKIKVDVSGFQIDLEPPSSASGIDPRLVEAYLFCALGPPRGTKEPHACVHPYDESKDNAGEVNLPCEDTGPPNLGFLNVPIYDYGRFGNNAPTYSNWEEPTALTVGNTKICKKALSSDVCNKKYGCKWDTTSEDCKPKVPKPINTTFQMWGCNNDQDCDGATVDNPMKNFSRCDTSQPWKNENTDEDWKGVCQSKWNTFPDKTKPPASDAQQSVNDFYSTYGTHVCTSVIFGAGLYIKETVNQSSNSSVNTLKANMCISVAKSAEAKKEQGKCGDIDEGCAVGKVCVEPTEAGKKASCVTCNYCEENNLLKNPNVKIEDCTNTIKDCWPQIQCGNSKCTDPDQYCKTIQEKGGTPQKQCTKCTPISECDEFGQLNDCRDRDKSQQNPGQNRTCKKAPVVPPDGSGGTPSKPPNPPGMCDDVDCGDQCSCEKGKCVPGRINPNAKCGANKLPAQCNSEGKDGLPECPSDCYCDDDNPGDSQQCIPQIGGPKTIEQCKPTNPGTYVTASKYYYPRIESRLPFHERDNPDPDLMKIWDIEKSNNEIKEGFSSVNIHHKHNPDGTFTLTHTPTDQLAQIVVNTDDEMQGSTSQDWSKLIDHVHSTNGRSYNFVPRNRTNIPDSVTSQFDHAHPGGNGHVSSFSNQETQENKNFEHTHDSNGKMNPITSMSKNEILSSQGPAYGSGANVSTCAGYENAKSQSKEGEDSSTFVKIFGGDQNIRAKIESSVMVNGPAYCFTSAFEDSMAEFFKSVHPNPSQQDFDATTVSPIKYTYQFLPKFLYNEIKITILTNMWVKDSNGTYIKAGGNEENQFFWFVPREWNPSIGKSGAWEQIGTFDPNDTGSYPQSSFNGLGKIQILGFLQQAYNNLLGYIKNAALNCGSGVVNWKTDFGVPLNFFASTYDTRGKRKYGCFSSNSDTLLDLTGANRRMETHNDCVYRTKYGRDFCNVNSSNAKDYSCHPGQDDWVCSAWDSELGGNVFGSECWRKAANNMAASYDVPEAPGYSGFCMGGIDGSHTFYNQKDFDDLQDGWMILSPSVQGSASSNSLINPTTLGNVTNDSGVYMKWKPTNVPRGVAAPCHIVNSHHGWPTSDKTSCEPIPGGWWGADNAKNATAVCNRRNCSDNVKSVVGGINGPADKGVYQTLFRGTSTNPNCIPMIDENGELIEANTGERQCQPTYFDLSGGNMFASIDKDA